MDLGLLGCDQRCLSYEQGDPRTENYSVHNQQRDEPFGEKDRPEVKRPRKAHEDDNQNGERHRAVENSLAKLSITSICIGLSYCRQNYFLPFNGRLLESLLNQLRPTEAMFR